jgi:hypothetical protein
MACVAAVLVAATTLPASCGITITEPGEYHVRVTGTSGTQTAFASFVLEVTQ